MTIETKESPTVSDLFDTPTPIEESSGNGDTPKEEVVEKKETEVTEEEVKEDSTDKEGEEATSESDDTQHDEKPTVDWEQRHKDAEKAMQKEMQARAKLEKELKAFKTEHGIEDAQPTSEEEALKLEERVATSEAIERERHGNEHIDKTLYAPDAPWQMLKDNSLIDFRVRNATSPITEALKVVQEHEFSEKYGNDPDTIKKNIKAELEPILRKEIKAEFEEKLKQKKAIGTDLSGVKSEEVTKEDSAYKTKSTEQLFG